MRMFKWIWDALTHKTEPGLTQGIDPNDNQYRRMKFFLRGAGGINGQTLRRLDNFTDPKPLNQED